MYKKQQLVKELKSPACSSVMVQRVDAATTLLGHAYFVAAIPTQDIPEILIKSGMPLPSDTPETDAPRYKYDKVQRRWGTNGPDMLRLWGTDYSEPLVLEDTGYSYVDKRSSASKPEPYKILAHVAESGEVRYYGLIQSIADIYEGARYELLTGGTVPVVSISYPSGERLALVAPAPLQDGSDRWLVPRMEASS